jgi:uncharacterized RDD family membrane protein YckC
MSEVGWYYDGGGQQVGPVGQAALVELIRSGGIAPGTRVWRPGLAGWTGWEAVAELAAAAVPPLGAPPPGGPPPPAASPFPSTSYAADVLAGTGTGSLYPKAPLGGRLLAALVDGLAVAPAGLLWVLAVAAFTAGSTGIGAVLSLLATAATVWALYYSFTKDGRPGGQSFGKRWMGLMVVHLPSNQPCDRGQSAIRYLVMFLLNLIPYLGWLVEPIVLLAAAGGRRLGDSAAGTQVIRATDYRPRR